MKSAEDIDEKKETTEKVSPRRRSDALEVDWSRALGLGLIAIASLLIGLFFLKYGTGWGRLERAGFEGLDLTYLGYLFLIVMVPFAYLAVKRAVSSRKYGSYTATCPYCGHETVFVEQPMDDFPCEDCHRRVPVLEGRILDITGVRCGFCGALNFMSEKTKVLICEECDREIPLLDPETGQMRHVAKGFARVDDDATYELVLVDAGKEREALINSLQHMLAMTRNQVKQTLDEMPAVLLRGINRRKAEMLRAQIEANDGTAELRKIE